MKKVIILITICLLITDCKKVGLPYFRTNNYEISYPKGWIIRQSYYMDVLIRSKKTDQHIIIMSKKANNLNLEDYLEENFNEYSFNKITSDNKSSYFMTEITATKNNKNYITESRFWKKNNTIYEVSFTAEMDFYIKDTLVRKTILDSFKLLD